MKTINILKSVILAVMAAAVTVACEPAVPEAVTDIQISVDKESIYVGEVANISVTFLPEGAVDSTYRLSLSEESYDFVVFEGLSAVKGIAPGKATIIVTLGELTDECEIEVKEYVMDAEAKISLIGSFAGEKVVMKEFPVGSGMYQTPMIDFKEGDTFQVEMEGAQTTLVGVAAEGLNVSYPTWRTGITNLLVKNFTDAAINGAKASISAEQAGKQVVVYDTKQQKLYIPAWSFVGQVEGSNWDAYLPIVIYDEAASVGMADGQVVMFHVLFEGEWKIWNTEEQAYYGLNTSEYIDGDEMYPLNTMRLPIWDENLNGGSWKNGIMNVTKDGEAFYVEGEWIQEYRIMIQPDPFYKEKEGDFAMGVQLPAGDDSVE